MLDITSKKDIELISLDLLKQSKALDIFPTPVNKIVDYSELVISKEIDLAHVDNNFFSKASDNFSNILEKVRGVLDRREKIIYLDLAQSINRQNFVKLHETGHGILPWQQQTMDFLDNDETLEASCEQDFEAEANYFASITLFQQDRFDSEIAKLPLGLESVTHLSKKFGASVHATFRRYIEKSRKKCSLLVLKNTSKKGTPLCQVRNYFQSQSFTKEFGLVNWNRELGFKWSFVKDYYFGRRFLTNGVISLQTNNGIVDFNYHFFNNTYNAFIFFFPKGEKNHSRTKFIISGA